MATTTKAADDRLFALPRQVHFEWIDWRLPSICYHAQWANHRNPISFRRATLCPVDVCFCFHSEPLMPSPVDDWHTLLAATCAQRTNISSYLLPNDVYSTSRRFVSFRLTQLAAKMAPFLTVRILPPIAVVLKLLSARPQRGHDLTVHVFRPTC